ncbi:MAG TPA: tyrosine--tRNA ligase [Candidatus Limnocylindria bacterium]|nr:tyrosine--tRNA ligase [Candidatus Limnocylindria bacterium]
MSMTLSEELAWRGFAHQTTYKDPAELDKHPITFFFGVDPSADSMQIGNLASAMMVRHFIDHGHKAVLLIGGATGMIGDPDGKKQERDLKTLDEIARNKTAIAAQYKTIFAGQDFEIVDNYDWFKGINYMDFLRDIGKHVPMRQMLGRDFVQSRLGEDGAGISYAEFSYALIQGYDFLHLHNEKKVTLQLCGADQWGNCIAGVELIRRIASDEAHVWSAPLIINKATGIKFGKTEGGAVWLDPAKTSVYQFYQFWLNVDDEGAIDYMKVYTLLSREEIDDIAQKFNKDQASRIAQKTLAYEVTKLVHGQKAADTQVKVAEALFGGGALELGPEEFKSLAQEFPVANVPKNMSTDDLVTALAETGLASSKTEARRFLGSGAIYINNIKLEPGDDLVYDASADYAIIRRGKNTTALLHIK